MARARTGRFITGDRRQYLDRTDVYASSPDWALAADLLDDLAPADDLTAILDAFDDAFAIRADREQIARKLLGKGE
jgi:hypothetical protein